MNTRLVRATAFARPADVTAYAQHDVIAPAAGAALLQFEIRGSGAIFGARVTVSANQATLPDLRLYLFDSPPTAIADNAAINLSDADAKKCVGVIELVDKYVLDAAAGDAGAIMVQGVLTVPFQVRSETKKISSLLVVNNAYTPTSGEEYEAGVYVGHDE